MHILFVYYVTLCSCRLTLRVRVIRVTLYCAPCECFVFGCETLCLFTYVDGNVV